MSSPRSQPSQAVRIAKIERRLRALETRQNIIPNSSLDAPVVPLAMGDATQGFAISSTAITTPCSLAIPVPDGYTRALVLATSDLTVSTGSSGATASCRTAIAGSFSPYGQSSAVAANDQQFVSNSFSKVVTGLSGGTISVQSQVASNGGNIAANASTWVNLNAMVVFLR